MIVEWGHFALILACGVSLIQALFPLLRPLAVRDQWIMVRAAVLLQCVLLWVAFASLLWAFYRNDLSVVYVTKHAHQLLPTPYRLAALWGGHEGSFLLWALILSCWSLLVSYAGRCLPPAFLSKVLAILGMISAGFLLFVLATSNPFSRYLPWLPQHGEDLNPLLQDPALVIHPPMLYAGYVGFAVAFAFAMAALWEKRLDQLWAGWVRPWVLLAWCCLTYGIVLGSWWAYRELGWGGWWFWDPVENASLMPWLAGTALLHSLITVHQKNHFRVWTIGLSIIAFSLSLLGTFLVRSGILVSVHAFAIDPRRGVFMLIYLLLVVGGALAMFAWRAPYLMRSETVSPGTRAHFLWLNNMCLAVMLLTVLLATLYPIFYQAMGWGKLSIGAPYFNQVMVLLAGPFLVVMGIGPHASWQRAMARRQWRWVAVLGAFVLLVALSCMAIWDVPWRMVWGGALALWVSGAVLLSWWRGGSWPFIKPLTLARLAMSVAHLGVAVFVLGVSVSSTYGLHQDAVLSPGDRLTLGSYQLRWVGMETVNGVNYKAVQANIALWHKGQQQAMLHPQQRVYTASGADLAKTAIDAGFLRDIYVAVGQEQQDGRWSFRVYYKPLVRWIWAGGIMMALGGLCAMLALWRSPQRIKQT